MNRTEKFQKSYVKSISSRCILMQRYIGEAMQFLMQRNFIFHCPFRITKIAVALVSMVSRFMTYLC